MEEINTKLTDGGKSTVAQKEKDTSGVQATTENNAGKQDHLDSEKNIYGREEVLKKFRQAFETAQKAKTIPKTPPQGIKWENNADSLDNNLRAKSEDAYIGIAYTIVNSAVAQLREQNVSKNYLKKRFTIFFIIMLSIQYAALAALLFIRSFQDHSLLSDSVIIAYISSVFLETLGAVIYMIRYAFASEPETEVLSILNSIIERFKKFSN